MMFEKVIAGLFLFVGVALSSNVVILTPENFDSVVSGSKHVLVEFFAPWCGHCKNLAPIYEEVADAYVGINDVVIASVDADAHRSLGSRFGVTGFPTLKFFPKGKKEPIAYSSGRDLDSFTKFIQDETGIRAKKAAGPREYTTVLTEANFDEIVMDSTKDVLVEFYAPWCGHCKTLAPKYEKVAAAFSREPNVVVAKVDADSEKALGARFGVSGYPTIKFFSKRDKSPQDYNGGRTEESFVDFLNKQAGTHRLPSGSLNENAGRIGALDDMIKGFFNKESREQTLEKAKKFVEATEEKWGSFYVRVMEKIHALEESGKDYIKDELNRLERMIGGGGVHEEKLDEFSIRKNILAAFNKIRGN